MAFLSGDQVHIPRWADALGLDGCPQRLGPETLRPALLDARNLAPLIVRYRDRLPEISG